MPSNVQQNGLWCFVLKSASIIYIGISMYIWYWEFEMYINVYLMYSMFHILIFHVANFFVGPKDHRKSTACVPGKLYLSSGLRLPLLSPPYHSSDSDDAKSAPGDDSSQGISIGDVSNFCLPIRATHGAGICTPTFAQTSKITQFCKSTSTMVRIWLGEGWWFVPKLIKQ